VLGQYHTREERKLRVKLFGICMGRKVSRSRQSISLTPHSILEGFEAHQRILSQNKGQDRHGAVLCEK
jgi:hypothetical protein